jgi:hypothetical protein
MPTAIRLWKSSRVERKKTALMRTTPTRDRLASFGHRFTSVAVVSALILTLAACRVQAAQVIAPDNGGGTATMPPAGESYESNLMQIINGLPVGTTVDIISPLFGSFSTVSEVPGGVFAGGTTSSYDAQLVLPMVGTGTLAGYMRTINMPLLSASQLMDFDARVPNTSPQSFDGDLRRMQGQIAGIGDPDFDLLRITAGGDFGMPSPGHTTLTNLGGGNWNVDSFFDIEYRIDFVGRPGGPFSGMSGSTTLTSHFRMGMPVPEPASLSMLAGGLVGLGFVGWRRRRLG